MVGTLGVGSTTALICDTGAILDYLVRGAPDHRRFRAAIDAARARYIPGLVLAEVDYFLRSERKAMRALIADLTSGAFTSMVRRQTLKRIGRSVVAVLPKSMLDRFHLEAGDEVHVIESSGGLLITPFDPDFATATAAYERGAKKYRNALRELAR